MGKTGFCAVFCLLLIVVDVSNASSIWKLRKLIGVIPNDSSTAPQITPSGPSPSPGSEIGKLNPKQKDDVESKKNSKDHPQTPNNSTAVDPKGSNKTVSVDPATANQTGDPASHEKEKKNDSRTDSEQGKKDDTKINTETDSQREKKDDTKINSQAGNIVSCDGILNNCTVLKTLIACIPNSESGSKELIVLVQNKGESTLKVNLTVLTSEENAFSKKPIEIFKHQTKTVKIPLPLGKSTKLKVNAENGECALNTGPQSLLVPEGNYILRLPSYEKLVTPVNGAYFLLLTVLMFGGTWSCCKLWKRRRQGGVPYQELEMGLPESASATNIETTEGWDNGWDDDWDEDNAVKSPGGRYVGSISANGLTSRSANKDGWENDWDD